MGSFRRQENPQRLAEPLVRADLAQPARVQADRVQADRIQADRFQADRFQADLDQPAIRRIESHAPAGDDRQPIREDHFSPPEPGRFSPRARRPPVQVMHFFPMTRVRLECPIYGERFVYCLLTWATKTFSVVTGGAFHLAGLFLVVTSFTSQVPRRVFYELMARLNAPYPPNASIWEHIFPAHQSDRAHRLRLTVHAPNHPHPTMVYTTSIPLLIDNPVFWFIMMVSMCMGHNLLCFVHGCFRNARERLEQQTET